MMNDDIRKLLSGYATNTLTEAERKALFEAALEDQELFNALQEEQPLKDLLSDPISRAQVQQALDTKPAPKIRWWAWSGALGAVAAAVLIVAVIRNEKPQPRLPQMAASRNIPGNSVPLIEQLKPQSKATPPAPSRRSQPEAILKRAPATVTPAAPSAPPPFLDALSERKDEKASAPIAANEPINAANQNQQAINVQNSLGGPSQNAQYQQAQGFRAQSAAALSSNLMLGKQSALLNYSLLKRDADGNFLPLPPNIPLNTGDTVRLTIVPAMPGALTLDQIDEVGRSKRIFPTTGSGLPVTAGTTYTIPDSAIQVADKDETYRVSLIPQGAQLEADGDLRAKKAVIRAKPAQSAPQTLGGVAPLALQITIGPGRTR